MIFSRVPSDGSKRNNWIKAISKYQQYDFFSIQFMVCDRHFTAEDFKEGNGKRKLKRHAVPTVFSGMPNCDSDFTQPQVVVESILNERTRDGKRLCNINNCEHGIGTEKGISFFR